MSKNNIIILTIVCILSLLQIVESITAETHFNSTREAEPTILKMIESGKTVDSCLTLTSSYFTVISEESIVQSCIAKFASVSGNINICNHPRANYRYCIDSFRVNFVPKPDSDARSILEIKNGTKSSVPKTKY